MADKVTGSVDWCGSKAWKNKTFHSFKIGDSFYRTGTDNPNVEKGDYIEFEFSVDDKGNKNVDVSTLKKVKEPAGNRGSGKALDKNGYWERKELMDIDKAIQYSFGASYNTAIAIVNLAIQNDAISLGAKKADKLDRLLAVVDEVATKLFVRNQDTEALRGLLNEEEAEVDSEEDDDEPDFSDDDLDD